MSPGFSSEVVREFYYSYAITAHYFASPPRAQNPDTTPPDPYRRCSHAVSGSRSRKTHIFFRKSVTPVVHCGLNVRRPSCGRVFRMQAEDDSPQMDPGALIEDHAQQTRWDQDFRFGPEYAVGETTMRSGLFVTSTVVALCTCGMVAGQPARIIYVDAVAVGANDGSSWADAHACLQDALAEAAAAVPPIQIRVAQGTYKSDQGADMTPGDRQATFQLVNGVSLKGGYAGVTAARRFRAARSNKMARRGGPPGSTTTTPPRKSSPVRSRGTSLARAAAPCRIDGTADLC